MNNSLYSIDPSQAMVLAHRLRWKIMRLLIQDEPIYAKQLAKELNVSESKIHYHLTQLRKAGLIELEGLRSMKQGRAKLLRPIATDFILSLLNNRSELHETVFDKLIFPRFCTSEIFEAQIVVGSSVPHGRYDAISRDGHLVGELCWYLGTNLASTSQSPSSNLVVTDLNYLSEKSDKHNNLILIGGHITNELTAKYNKTLKEKFNVFFTENKIVAGELEFSDPNQALIAIFRNPIDKEKWVLILAGVRSLGTKSAIYSIVNDNIEILSEENEFVVILKGDLNEDEQISGVTGLLTKSLN
ncbi:MAG: ArsR/SmtB family transcription factor [Candidatus Hodarchaeales archaeon]|jgi:DNA-binding transcriptional ArsR family regulator